MMRGLTFYKRFSRDFHDNPSLVKLLLVFTVSGGGVVAYSESKSYGLNVVHASEADSKKKRVVVLGTGWAGTSFLKNLKNSEYDVQVISPRNYFAFTPLLPSVTCGTVDARSVVEPVRKIIRKKTLDIHYWEAECFKIDAQNKKVYCRSSQDTNLSGEEEFVVDYDYLVIAIGARVNTFNTPGVEENCHFLKEVEDAQKIRRTVIDCFERASLPTLSDEERKRILQFVIVGGGPTGVEFAAELHDFVSEDIVKLYPQVKDLVKITLLEAGEHILNMFDKRITAFAEKIPKGCPIDVTNRRVLATDEWLRVEGCDSVYALGDCATINQRKVMEDIAAIFSKADKDNSGTLTVKELQEVIDNICQRYPKIQKSSLPGGLPNEKSSATAQVAAQQGSYLADCFNRMEECEKNPEGPLRFRGEGRHRFRPFRYKHFGQFAPLGGEQTAAQLPGDWVSIGHSSQWLWYSVYASKQVSWRTRVLVVSDWTKRFIFGRDSSSI
ncbi:NAD(P)H dehydrogenase B2 [Actinidia rufa]|uniref:NADH:ubiquinone reductase (non-electrogenic) n=1 Tax=Actinidia rufa TaxID=165716 RepID=A0A7J0EZC1_9ERIC|nr:NAD(P)H dehydrogenase B2 [Actinidia rufa]